MNGGIITHEATAFSSQALTLPNDMFTQPRILRDVPVISQLQAKLARSSYAGVTSVPEWLQAVAWGTAILVIFHNLTNPTAWLAGIGVIAISAWTPDTPSPVPSIRQRLAALNRQLRLTHPGTLHFPQRPEQLMAEIANFTEVLTSHEEALRNGIREALARSVSHHRALHLWRIQDVAERAGVPLSIISTIENRKGALPTKATQEKLATAFGVPVEALAPQRSSRSEKDEERNTARTLVWCREIFGIFLSWYCDAYGIALIDLAKEVGATSTQLSQAAIGRSELSVVRLNAVVALAHEKAKGLAPSMVVRSVDQYRLWRLTREIDKALGRRIRQERVTRGNSVDQLAEAAGMLPGNLSALELGYAATRAQNLMDRIASALKLPIEQLLAPLEGLFNRERSIKARIAERQDIEAANLLRLRNAKNLSLPQLAERSGLSKSSLAYLEEKPAPRRMRLDPAHLPYLARGLSSTVEMLWPANDLLKITFGDQPGFTPEKPPQSGRRVRPRLRSSLLLATAS